MAINKINKGNLIFMFLLVVFLCFPQHVLAAQKTWPEYKYKSPVNSSNEPLDIFYCRYNMGTVKDWNDNKKKEYYNNGTIMLALFDNNIYWVDPTGGSIELANKAWDTSFVNQNIKYNQKKINNYLIGSDGKLNCNALNFYEYSDNLLIETPDDYNAMNLSDTLKTPAVSGNLMLKGKYATGSEDPNAIVVPLCSQTELDLLTNKKNELLSDFNSTIDKYIGEVDKLHNASAATYANSKDKYYAEVNNKIKSIRSKFSSNTNDCNYGTEFENIFSSLGSEMKTSADRLWTKITSLTNEAKTTAAGKGEDTSQYDAVNNSIGIAKDNTFSSIDSQIGGIRDDYEKLFNPDSNGGSDDGLDCETLLGPELINIINEVLLYVKIGVPILLIVLGSVDFSRAVLADEKDDLKKATSRFVKRCIIAVAIFFLPTILNMLFEWFNLITGKEIMNCGIR